MIAAAQTLAKQATAPASAPAPLDACLIHRGLHKSRSMLFCSLSSLDFVEPMT